MRFWWRELGGWLLIGLGLLCFAEVWYFCKHRWLLEAWPMTLIGIILFWGGIHLLKVAVAARICRETQDRLYPAAPPAPKSGERGPGFTTSSARRRATALR